MTNLLKLNTRNASRKFVDGLSKPQGAHHVLFAVDEILEQIGCLLTGQPGELAGWHQRQP